MGNIFIKQKSSNSAFTLIELLVVIAIIGILMSLLFPAVQGAINAAKRAETAALITSIRNAINAYETEYGVLPNVSSGDMFLSDSTGGQLLIEALTGGNPGSPPLNPRQIRFIEIAPKFYVNRDPSTHSVINSWGNAFRIGISKNYSTVDMGGPFSNQPLKTTVAVASGDKDNVFSDSKAIKTW